MKQDILIYSSRIRHSEQIQADLNKHDISVSIVFNADEALASLVSRPPAFFWLDIDTEDARLFLKDLSDRFLRPPPYIILTSSFADSTDRAVMLDHGADACVELPIDLPEILSILNAVLRREDRLKFFLTTNILPCIEHKELFIDPLRREVKMRGKPISLTSKEFDILHLLANSPGVVFTKEQIYFQVWHTNETLGASSVSDHISSLRQKLGLHPKDAEYIQTVFKVGYRFAEYE